MASCLDALLSEVRAAELPVESPRIDGHERPGPERPVVSPIDGKTIGRVPRD